MEHLKHIINSGAYGRIHGWCPADKAIKMAEIIMTSNAELIVELGVFGGRSLLPMAMVAKNGKVIGIDAWEINASLEGENSKENDDWWSKIDNKKMMEYTDNLLKKYGCFNFELWKSKSKDVVHKFQTKIIDFLHQDSNHSEVVSCEEVELYYDKVKIGGTWVFDDTNWETTKKAQALLLTKGYEEVYDAKDWKVYVRVK